MQQVDLIRGAFGDAGVVEGLTVRIEYRWADGDYEKLLALAANLVNQKAARATKTILVVFGTDSDPSRPA